MAKLKVFVRAGMAVSSKAVKSTLPPITAGQGQSSSLNYIPTSIANRTRTQLAASSGQRTAVKTKSSSKVLADKFPYSPGQLLVEEEEESEESSIEDEKPTR